jgi:hypothetical protein
VNRSPGRDRLPGPNVDCHERKRYAVRKDHQFAAGAVAGGFADANTVGFAAFYLTAAQQVTIQVSASPVMARMVQAAFG